MKKFLEIIGLPCSGKTFLTENMLIVDPDLVILDDISRLLRVTHKGLYYYEVVAQFPNHERFVLSDPAFCNENFRLQVESELSEIFGNVEFKQVWFENNLEQCLRNLELRNDGRKINHKYVERMSNMYKIPKGANVVSVWKPDDS